MSDITEYLENPTISKITRQEKNKYQMSCINVMDLLKRIDILEKQTKEYEKDKKSVTALKRELSANKSEIKELKSKCLYFEQEIKENENSEVLLKQKINAYEDEIKSLKSKYLNSERDNKENKNLEFMLKQQNSTYENEIKSLKSICSNLEQKIEENKNSEVLLKEQNSTYEKEIRILQYKCSNLEKQIIGSKNLEGTLKQKTTVNKNEINRLKITYSELEKQIQRYEMNKQSKNSFLTRTTLPKTTLLVEEQKKTVKIGEIIKFGKYKGKEIEWQVLDINQKDNSVLLISKYALFTKAFHDKKEDCTWETSTLRSYLNNEFCSNTFSETEKLRVKEELIKNSNYKNHDNSDREDTQDMVFLLSVDEANKYFKTDEERSTFKLGNEYTVDYWLRSSGIYHDFASEVGENGKINEVGVPVHIEYSGVRPALWVNL